MSRYRALSRIGKLMSRIAASGARTITRSVDASGLAIDSRDHIWVINLPNSFTARTEIGADTTPPIGECCHRSPNVLEFDSDGKLVGSWGGPGPGYTWPSMNNGIAVAPNGNLWIGGPGARGHDIVES